MWNTIKTFCAVVLKDKIKDLIKDLIAEGKKYIWKKIEKEIKEGAIRAIELIEAYLASDEGKVKKETIANIVMSKVELPVVLRPFKNLIKKKFLEKIEETVVTLLANSKAKLNLES